MENLIERQETGKILPEPQTMLLRNRRHPNMAKSDRRTKKLSSLGIAGTSSSNRRTRTFINARKRSADDSSRSSISFHDVFVVKQRKGLGFLTSDADEGSTISAQPPSVLCTLGSIESLGKESVGIRGELCHLQNKAAEIAREEEAYWREMSVVGGPQRIDTGSRLAFSPKSRGAADRDANPRGGSGGDNTAEEGKKANVLKSSTNIPDHHQQQGAASLGSEDDTNMKTAAEAKVERREALDHIDEIIATADAVMVARGDLGVEIPLEDVPMAQQTIIDKALERGMPVIVATQMLDSMTLQPRPTRAEVSDVSTAIRHGATGVMLSGETASGIYPLETVKTMAKIAYATEQGLASHDQRPNALARFRSTRAVAHAGVELAKEAGATHFSISAQLMCCR